MKQTVFSNLLHEINSYIDQGNDAIKRGKRKNEREGNLRFINCALLVSHPQ